MSVELIARAWENPVQSGRTKRSPYSAGWTRVVGDLRGELRHIGARRAIVEMDVDTYDIRNDGWIRSSARPRTPGVRLSFTCKHGPLNYECSTWSSWEHNLYAIARTLRAQRMMARDGAVKGDQIYMGFKALPGGGAANPQPTAEFAGPNDARAFLATIAGIPNGVHPDVLYREAARKAHPDTGGSNDLMAKVNRAKAVIDAHEKVTA